MSPSGLHSMRLMVERYCVTPCTLYRGGVLLNPQPTMRDGSPLRCRIKDDKQTRIEGADVTQTMMRWLITLPNSVDVRDQDHLRTRDREYVLAPIANPDSDSPRNKCYAYALYPLDADGNPGQVLYLRPNCVVNVTRSGVAVPNMTDVSVQVMPAGVMNLNMQGVQFTTDIEADPGTVALPTSWQMNDVMTLVGAPAFQMQGYTVLSAIPPYPMDPLPRWKIRVDGYLR